MFKPVPSQVDFVAQEHQILEFWKESDAFRKLQALRAGGPRWSFIDGPITANNPMGVHHGWGRTYKDLFHRHKAMQGFSTRYQNGFDCQGLWVEVNVERDMGFRTKRDIEAFGLAEFVILCKQRVLTYAAVQTEQSIRLGYWMEWDDPEALLRLRDRLGRDPAKVVTYEGPRGSLTGSVEAVVGRLGALELGGSYFTFSDENNYTIWSVLKSCHDRGWIYKGTDVMPWCARCGTGLSQHEIVTEGYQELIHPSITFRMPLIDRPGESLLVWTTTPWTLTSNVAAAVGPDLEYVKVRQGDEVFYLSKGTTQMLTGAYEVLRELRGQEMLGWRYRGPFDDLRVAREKGVPEAHQVIAWNEVGEEEGTGIVHIAPGCGAEDFVLGKAYDLPVLAPLDEAGIFVEGYGWLSGKSVQEVTDPIYADLEVKDLAYRRMDYRHRYPVCWRCGEELIFRLVDEWFISMGEQLDKPYEQITEQEKERNLRYQMMEVVLDQTRWYPSFGLERELDWLRNMHDWMISKKRYWGLALPIWECAECGHFEVIGNREELRRRAIAGWEALEGHTPHRPYIDEVRIACTKCGSAVTRIPDVGNPWLDAGIVAMSTLGYNENREYWKDWFPADLISESFPGQFRNWFYSLLAMSTILERKAPFRDVFTYALLLGEDGRPMHKSWGNAIEFNEAADKMGVDVVRWMYCDHKPEKDLLFGYHRADEVRRKFLIPLWNVYSFFVTYANIDGWTPDGNARKPAGMLDRWILARLSELVEEVSQRLDGYEPDLATEAVNRFIDDLSNWYLRRSRRRFWSRAGRDSAADADKNAAYNTLYTVLVTLCDLLAPFVPFATEAIYQNLVRIQDTRAPESVHHREWPRPDQAHVDKQLLAEMTLVKRLVSLGHSARNSMGRKLRQPLAEAALAVGSSQEREIVERHADLIADELNVKKVRLLDAASEVVEFRLNPLPKQLGQKYGSRFPALRQAIQNLPPLEPALRLLRGESITVDLPPLVRKLPQDQGTGESLRLGFVTLQPSERIEVSHDEVEVRVEARPGFSAAAEGSYLAALTTELTPKLEMEGLAREFVRRVQEMRKQAGFDVSDRVQLSFNASERIDQAIEQFVEYVMGETLAVSLVRNAEPGGEIREDHAFDGQKIRVALTRAAKRPD